MRATAIEFDGYRRLRSARCNVDARLVAFLGPNEAGKSSVLDGLFWHYDGGALPSRDRYRPAKPSDGDTVVSVIYRVDDQDVLALGGLLDEIEERPTAIECARPADAHTMFVTVTPSVRRRREPFTRAHNSVARVQAELAAGEVASELEISTPELADLLVQADQVLNNPDSEWGDDSAVFAAAEASTEAAATPVDDEPEPARLPWAESFNACAAELTEALRINGGAHPAASVRNALFRRRPAFLKFSQEDRELRDQYDLSDDALRDEPPKALLNLLGSAGVSIEELWRAIQDGDVSAFRSLESLMNKNLERRVQPSWRQSKLTLELNVNASGLIEVLVMELDSTDHAAPRIVVTERSDGLRTFLALSCFLGARKVDQPPILLIDEVETHLHLDAQADLISLLASDAEIGQVLYTTHSPGALPLDLGTSLRFVSRDTREMLASVLTNSFWDQNSPGFSRLLFAMGAGAAAFSAFRRAVVCEGAADMILLPTLFRIARDGKRVEFQIAPGLSSVASVDPSLRDIAIDTAFLVDGDGSGDEIAQKLENEAGYPHESIFHLPQGKALEDLIEPDVYLAVVQELMTESGSDATLNLDALDRSQCIASAVDAWAKQTKTKVPGHVLPAVRLAADPSRIKLTREGAAELRALYDQIMLRLRPPA